MAQKICCGGFTLGEGLKLDPKTKTLNATGGGSGGTQSDWNENNPDAPGYVKNRPFYDTGEMAEVEVVPEFVGNFTYDDFIVGFACTEHLFPIKMGESYTVYWDGLRYDTQVAEFNGIIYIGNPSAIGVEMPSEGDAPFLYASDVGFVTQDESETHTIRVTTSVARIIYLPDKYISPDIIEKIDAKTGASNLQSGEIYNDYANNKAGPYAHAEGLRSSASGTCAHAEGNSTIASGNFSHAEGQATEVNCDHQHVQGRYNLIDNARKYAHIVGNGESYNYRSNAHTLDWEGNAWFAGSVEGTSVIVKSSTPGSVKRFRITVDDSGTIKATQI